MKGGGRKPPPFLMITCKNNTTMTKEELKQYIDENVYENPDGDITGESLNAVLKAIVDDGGTEVEANPVGEATTPLNKIKIGETKYNIPQTDTGNLVTEQELQQTLNSYVQKTDPPSPAAGDIVVYDENGGFGNSGKKVTDFVTKSVNDLVNYYLKSETYTKAEVAALIGAIQQFHYEIYAALPQTGQGNVLYLIGPTGTGKDKYEEYVYANGDFIPIGDTSIDLSGYVTTDALNTALADYTPTESLTTLLAGKQDTISDLQQIRTRANEGHTALQPKQSGQYTQGNIVIFDANGGLADSQKKTSDFATTAQGEKADNAIPMPTGTDGQILEKDSNETGGVKWVPKPQDGKSALQIYNETYGTNLNEAQFIDVLKQNYPMEYVAYDATAAAQTIGTGFASIGTLTADSTTAGKMYLMPNNGTTPTGTILFVTVQTGVSTYAWYKLGDLDVPSNVLTDDKIDNSFAGGSGKVASANEMKTVFVDNAKTSNSFNFNFNGALATELNVEVIKSNNTIIATTYQDRYLAIPCKGGDVIEIERNDTTATIACFLKTLIPYRVNQPLVFSDEIDFTTVRNLSTVGYHYSFTVPQDVTYILVQVRTGSALTNNQTPRLLKLNGIDLFKSFSERVDEKVQYGSDLSSKVTLAGNYNISGGVTKNDGWRHYLLEVKPGDVVVTNYKHNVSHTYAYNCLFAADGKTLVRLFQCTDNYLVTIDDWNAGARYYGISYRLAEPSVGGTPYLYVTRNFGMSAMYTADDLSAAAKIVKDKVVVKLDNLSNFDVFAYDKRGREIHHHFIREHKEWDSLEYLDENGETQTATNIQSANIWYCEEIKYGTKHICQGNTNFINSPLPPVGNNFSLGNGHGCEVMQYVKFLIDGKDFDISVSSDEFVGNEFKMVMMTHIYPSAGGQQYVQTNKPKLDTNGNPVVLFKHFMEVTITSDSDVIVDNKLEVCQDGVSWLACDSAMMECDFGDFNTVVLSGRGKTYMASLTDEGTPTAIAGTDGVFHQTAVYASKVEMYGKGFYVSNEIIPIFNDAHCVVFPFYYDDRLKCYLYPVRCGRAVGNDTPQVFNTGDIIATHNIRHVRLSDDIEV